ncbi:unnamed protein product [Clonostachys rosea]|uniref:SnoaL-like domain-containing protein n=1 Tax=Bionectria ochroleuca TaxID=29856 RepID=A0ABY6UMS8_BIOOC|nr:unnamed protein product [Clonostachys rosea]
MSTDPSDVDDAIGCNRRPEVESPGLGPLTTPELLLECIDTQANITKNLKMGYSIDSATWPEGVIIPTEVKILIERFFQTVDTNRDDAGDILADELFDENGVAYFGAHPFRGPEEIRKSRAHAWDAIETRKHKVLRVYTRAPDCNDLLFVAHVAMGLKNGKSVDGEFVGRFTISNAESKGPKLSLYQVWGDTSALRAALEEK